MKRLMSRWGERQKRDDIWQEYPRPNLVRESYFNLNGMWEYAIRRQGEVMWDGYDGKIQVPFSPETVLSGVERMLEPGQCLYYKKKFCLPGGFIKSRVLLHFGAVDQECEVFLNGILLGSHKGGYLPFCFDVTTVLMEENELTLCVTDWTEKRPHARGKQKLVKKGPLGSLFYTPQSGIWQTVWMESVEETYVDWVKITPMYDESAVRLRIGAVSGLQHQCPEAKDRGAGNGATEIQNNWEPGGRLTETAALARGVMAQIVILDAGKVVAQAQAWPGRDIVVSLSDFHPWTPENPHLYDVRIVLGADEVRSYFGMRKVSTGRDKNGILRFFLNNEPYFFNGVLDQGYWPESLMTPPCDAALVYDIKKLKGMGYNTIRKHVKIESERFYYHCDRLGMAVWQDMPNGGGEYDMVFVTYLPNLSDRFARGTADRHYGRFKREDKEGRRQYLSDLTGMVKHLYNHPCIVTWIPFNEGWGQFDAAKVTERLKRLDKSRLINEACGWFDQKGGDVHSIHNYGRRLKVEPKERVVALTEYGGYAYPVKGHTACEKEFGYRHYRSRRELTQNYRRLWEEEIIPNVPLGLSAAIYTQISDIEEEINGIMTYDRSVDKLEAETVRELNQRLYECFCIASKRG